MQWTNTKNGYGWLSIGLHWFAAIAVVVMLVTGFQADFAGGAGDRATRSALMGLHISFAGMITYKTADDLRKVAATIPLDRLLVETDSPYLAPVPVRGKRNEPAFVRHTAECVATAVGVTADVVSEATTRNARALFGL